MKVETIYKKQRFSLQELNPSNTTLATLFSSDSGFSTVYIKVSDPSLTRTYMVNLNELMLETPIGRCVTWAEVEATLTLSHLQMYEATIDTTGTKQPHVVSVLSSTDFTVSYGSLMTPNVRNMNSLKWKLKDLIITKKNTCPINFNNCICSVNGVMVRPIIYHGEMFIPNGATYLYNTGIGKGANIVLIDFTPLGGCTCIPFSYCKKKITNMNFIENSDMYLTIPEDKDLTNKTVFVAMGYTLDLLDNATVVSPKDVLISPYKWPLALSLSKSYESSAKYVRNTQLIHVDTTVESYLLNGMFSPDHYGAFLLVVNNPSINRTLEYCTELLKYKTYRCKQTPSILVHENSKAILDYTHVPYNTEHILYIDNPPAMHLIKEPEIKNIWSAEQPNLSTDDIPENYRSSRYVSVTLSSI